MTEGSQPLGSSRPLTLALAGDVMLGRLVNDSIRNEGFAYPWGDLLPVLRAVDLFFVNLECALTSKTERWRDGGYKPFYFRADPAAVETLKAGRVDCVSVANNHIGDFGTPGMLETLRVLDAAGIAHAGAGIDLAVAQEPAYLTCRGYRLAVLAFADYPAAWAATSSSPGLNFAPVSLADDDFAPVARQIAAARARADLLIFSIHWGPNMRARPSQLFREFARRVVDAGVDIFWGHSAHVLQGIEIYRGRPILYDCGDLIDDYAVDSELRNDHSALLLVHVRPPIISSVEIVPLRIARMQANLASRAEHAWITARMTRLCREMGTLVGQRADRLVVDIEHPASSVTRDRDAAHNAGAHRGTREVP